MPWRTVSSARASDEANGDWTSEMAGTHAGHTCVQIAAAVGSERFLELMLQNGAAPVDAEDRDGKTALQLAVEAGEAGCVHQLLTRGANISHADHRQQTPMQARLPPQRLPTPPLVAA